MNYKISFSKLKNITPKKVDNTYDFEVKESHRIIAKHINSENAFYTSNCKHPDAQDFINSKLDSSKITGANISIKLDNKFMNAVVNKGKYEQQFPLDTDTPIMTKEIDAYELWMKIINNAHKSAEPGILFWDNILNESISDCYKDFGFNTVSTNPCFAGDTLIECKQGDNQFQLTIKELTERFINGEQFEILSLNTKTMLGQFKPLLNACLTKKNTETLLLTFSTKTQLRVTPDHEIYTLSRGYVKASELNCSTDNFVFLEYTATDDKYVYLESITKFGNEDVYDITVQDNHNLFANGILAKNCGEIPLSPMASCILLSINLYNCVDSKFTKDAKLNKERLIIAVMMGQRALDNVIDLEIEKVQAIISKIQDDPEDINIKQVELNLWHKILHNLVNGRRTGLGTTAWGDFLAALNIINGTQEAIDLAKEVQGIISTAAYRSSVQLAKERGCFPIWNYELEKDNPLLNRLFEFDSTLKDELIKYGRRNISLLTVPPGGTLSIMTQTTSGIEPVFMVAYQRRRKLQPNEEALMTTKISPDELGDKWVSYNVLHHRFYDWYKVYVNDPNVSKSKLENMTKDELDELIKVSPYYKASANEINWVNRIKFQAAIQSFICHSISSTVNLPNDVSIQTVSDIYMEAWKSGCKGVTVYRDGSRVGILTPTSKRETKVDTEIIYTTAPKRPKSLSCDIQRINVKGVQYIVLIGLLKGKPYEIFAFKKTGLTLPAKIKSGTLKKQKKGQYSLILEDGLELENIAQYFGVPDEEVITRLLSSNLRHGVDIKFLYEQLLKTHGELEEFCISLARGIKKYVNGEPSDKTCPLCKKDTLRYESGCVYCTNEEDKCTYSLC